MKAKIISAILLIVLMLLVEFAKSQKVCVVQSKQDANVIAYRTNYISEADLLVYTTKYVVDANTVGKWFYVNNKQSATWKVYFTKYKYEADINIMWTTYPVMAGWQRNKRRITIK